MKSNQNRSTTQAIHKMRYHIAVALKYHKLSYISFDSRPRHQSIHHNDNVTENLSSKNVALKLKPFKFKQAISANIVNDNNAN